MLAHFCILTLVSGLAWAAPVQLTRGPGNDTEAAWSPDGTWIVFQSDRDGDTKLFVLDIESQKTTRLDTGPGHACFPAWAPDGKWIVYAHAHFTQTALAAARAHSQNGYNLYAVPAAGGAPQRLTTGRVRDYCPTFSPDGETLYFASTRGRPAAGRRAGVHILAVDWDAKQPKPRIALPVAPGDNAAVQPTCSPDGRVIAFGYLAGYKGDWTIRLARADAPSDAAALTGEQAAFYGPRWSPTGSLLACTGFEPGDPGWGVWLIDARTGRRQRFACGPGNSRSPAWSPNGRRLVFENNRTGRYKLYVVDAPPAAAPPRPAAKTEARAVLHFRFGQPLTGRAPDLSGRGNDGRLVGPIAWGPRGAAFKKGRARVSVPQPKGLDFGQGAFAVKATVTVTERVDRLSFICMGKYPDNTLGWQLFVDKKGRALFNSRTPDLKYVGVASDSPLPLGREATIVGERLADGRVVLFVNGLLQCSRNAGATRAYGKPLEVRVGRQHNGGWPFCGWIREVTVYRGAWSPDTLRREALARFWRRVAGAQQKGAAR